MYKLLTILLLIFIGLNTRASGIDKIDVDAGTDPIIKADTPSFTIPFTMAGNLILVKGKVDSTEGNFILDTGAPGLVLNITYFRSYTHGSTPHEQQQGITGNGDIALQTAIQHFRFGTFNYYKVETDLVNLGHLETKRGVKILGLIGVSMLKQCELIIDYGKKELHLHCISRKEKDTYRHPMIENASIVAEYPFELSDNRILIKTLLNNKKLKFVVDYGAETNILDSRLPGNILDSIEIRGRIMLNGTSEKKIEALSGVLSGFRLADLRVTALPVVVTNLEHTCFGGICVNGVLGYDFLSRYMLCFNFVKQKLYISQ